MQSWFTFELDGSICRVEHEATHETLANYLSRLDSCFHRFASGDSWLGGIPVIIGDLEGDVPSFRVADACLLLLPMLADRQVWTPEGIRNTNPYHPAALAATRRKFECGEDREATLVALFFEGYYRSDLRRIGQMNEQFDSLISRTAYIPAIRQAAAKLFASSEQLRHEAAQRADKSGKANLVWTGRQDIHQDQFSRRLHRQKGRKEFSYVDRSKRRFHRPSTLTELLKLKREYPDAQIIAGGTTLAQKSGHVEWPNLISVESVKELGLILTQEDSWEIGAAVSLTRVAETIGRECEPFTKILRRFGSRPIRNRATLGGYLATAWSLGQLSPLLLALNARVILVSDEGERDAPLSQFFEPREKTILNPGEVIRSIIIPRATDSVLAGRGMTSRICDVYTVSPRRSLAEPYVTGAFALELREGVIAKAWIAYSGVGDRPVRARETENQLAGKTWNEETVFSVLNTLNQDIKVTRGEHDRADRDYRKQLVITLFQKFFYQHPGPDEVKAKSLSATGEFARPNQPFFDTVGS